MTHLFGLPLVRAYCEMGLPQGSEAVKVVSQLAVVFYCDAVRDQQPRPSGLGQKEMKIAL